MAGTLDRAPAASIPVTIVMVLRRNELPPHERWLLAISAVATVSVCFIGSFVAVFIDLVLLSIQRLALGMSR